MAQEEDEYGITEEEYAIMLYEDDEDEDEDEDVGGSSLLSRVIGGILTLSLFV